MHYEFLIFSPTILSTPILSIRQAGTNDHDNEEVIEQGESTGNARRRAAVEFCTVCATYETVINCCFKTLQNILKRCDLEVSQKSQTHNLIQSKWECLPQADSKNDDLRRKPEILTNKGPKILVFFHIQWRHSRARASGTAFHWQNIGLETTML